MTGCMTNDHGIHDTYLNASGLGDMLGVRAATICRWARQGHIPKITLPNGRFVFDKNEVLDALKQTDVDSVVSQRATQPEDQSHA